MGLAPGKQSSCYLIDFGLARRFLLPNGEVRLPRDQTGFRGTARYASINSHQSKDLSRRDDLWSLLYVLIEFAKGQLPWRRIKDKDQVGEMKITYDNPELVSELPHEFLLFMQHLQTLRYGDKPNYGYIHSLLDDLFRKIGGEDSTPFDWDRVPSRSSQRPRPIPSLVDLCFLRVAVNIDRYPSISGITPQARKDMFDFLIRVHSGSWNGEQMNRLLDKSMVELDLSKCELADADYFNIIATCSKTKIVSLGPTSDLVVKELVSKNNLLEQLSLVAVKGLTSKALKQIAENCSHLKSLKLVNSEKASDKLLEYLIRSCPDLQELNLSGCKKVKGLAFKPFAAVSSSKAKTKKRPFSVTRLDLSGCELSKSGFKALVKVGPRLTSLVLSPLVTNFKISSNDFHALIHNCANLQVLELENRNFEMDTILVEVSRCCSQLTTLRIDGVGISDYGLQNIIQNCSKLETLRFRYGDGVTDTSLLQIAKSCNVLRSLTLDFWNKFNRLSLSDQAIKNLLQSCANLTELSLCNCLILTGTCFPENGFFPNLQYLNLSECIQLNDFAIRRITEICPELRHLELNNLNNLTPASLEAIALGCPKLKELHLNQCACFLDESMKSLLKVMPKLFLHVTRFTDPDLKGNQFEVHSITVDKIFEQHPNTQREKAFERTRKRMFGMES